MNVPRRWRNKDTPGNGGFAMFCSDFIVSPPTEDVNKKTHIYEVSGQQRSEEAKDDPERTETGRWSAAGRCSEEAERRPDGSKQLGARQEPPASQVPKEAVQDVQLHRRGAFECLK